MREIVVYVPRGGCSATAGIARGSAIVGEPRAGAAEVEIYFEGAIFGQENMRTLADRATHAAGWMLERYATTATRIVPRDALLAVGTFDFHEGRIPLIGSDSERAVAVWLGTPRLDPAELAQGARGRRAAAHAAAVPDVPVAVTRSLGEALIERAGIRRERDGAWTDAEGRRTSAIAEALTWALVVIAQEVDPPGRADGRTEHE
jgi:hypothetical protein